MSHDSTHQPGERYTGQAQLISEEHDVALEVEVQLRGLLEPIDGHFHWYGRIAPNPELDDRHRSGASVAVRTPHGTAAGRLNDIDPWGRFRISGLGTPPF